MKSHDAWLVDGTMLTSELSDFSTGTNS